MIRLFNRVKTLQKIVKATEQAIPGVAGAFFLLLLVIAIYSILAVDFFSDLDLGEEENRFATFNDSFFVLFQVMTGDGWSNVARTIMGKLGFKAELFFLSYVLLTSFLLVNITIAVLLENMFFAEGEQEVLDADTYYTEVLVRWGQNLPAADLSGFSDPYCEVTFVYPADMRGERPPDTTSFTKVCQTTNDPMWEETFSCKGKPERVEFRIADKDYGMKGKVAGTFRKLGSMLGGSGASSSRGDELIGVQTRPFSRMFQVLERADAKFGDFTVGPTAYTLPLYKEMPKYNRRAAVEEKIAGDWILVSPGDSNYMKSFGDGKEYYYNTKTDKLSKEEPVQDSADVDQEEEKRWLLGQNNTDKDNKYATLTFSMLVGRHLYTKDTDQLLTELSQIHYSMNQAFDELDHRLVKVERLTAGPPGRRPPLAPAPTPGTRGSGEGADEVNRKLSDAVPIDHLRGSIGDGPRRKVKVHVTPKTPDKVDSPGYEDDIGGAETILYQRPSKPARSRGKISKDPKPVQI